MAKESKISIRKILQVLLTFVVAISCIVAMISAARIEDNKLISSVKINIFSDKKYHSIEEKQIMDEALNNRNIDVLHTPVGKLDMQTMEHVLKTDPWIADAQIFVDNNLVLHISVTQRIPVARFFDKTGNSYYIDTTMSTMPLSSKFVCYTPVVTNVPVFGNDSLGMSLKRKIVSMVRNIQADTFWAAQVSQIILDSDYSFEIVPVIGDQKIIFGDTSRMKEKFSNLYTFYKNVLNRIGWDRYETLDLRFKGQVIASPSLPYKGPVDKAVVNMNWVSSIVETEARKDSARAALDARLNSGDPEGSKIPVKKELKKDIRPAGNAKDRKDAHGKESKPVASAAKKDIKKAPEPHTASKPDVKKGEHINTDKNKGKPAAKYTYPENKNH